MMASVSSSIDDRYSSSSALQTNASSTMQTVAQPELHEASPSSPSALYQTVNRSAPALLPTLDAHDVDPKDAPKFEEEKSSAPSRPPSAGKQADVETVDPGCTDSASLTIPPMVRDVASVEAERGDLDTSAEVGPEKQLPDTVDFGVEEENNVVENLL